MKSFKQFHTKEGKKNDLVMKEAKIKWTWSWLWRRKGDVETFNYDERRKEPSSSRGCRKNNSIFSITIRSSYISKYLDEILIALT